MFNHAPPDYQCPLCITARGEENDHTMAKQSDIFYKDDLVFAMINSKFVGNNPGHVIVVPVQHHEHIYDLPDVIAHRISDVAKQVAVALKAVRKCDGIMTLQNNEPASGQHAFHFHLHIFPRFAGDKLGQNLGQARVSDSSERVQYASDLRRYFQK